MEATVTPEVTTFLRFEVLARSRESAISYFILGTLLLLHGFASVEYIWVIRCACIGIIMSSLIRFQIWRKWKHDAQFRDLFRVSESPQSLIWWNRIAVLMVANAVLWGMMFSMVILEHGLFSVPATFVLMLMSSLTLASIFTLSAMRVLQVAFCLLMIVPTVVTCLYWAWIERDQNSLLGALLMSVFLSYVLRQGAQQKQNLLALFHQTAIAQHSSRLAAIGEMAAGIAHEINNPLAIIQSSIDLIKRNASERLIENDQKTLDKAKAAITRITRIISSMRGLSRMDTALSSEAIEVRTFVQEAIDICREKIRQRGIDLQVIGLSESRVSGSSVQLSQVVLNLLQNALDALPEEAPDSQLWIRIQCVEKNGKVSLKVANAGAPISAEVRAKMFNPFFTTKLKGKGTGLGLSISRSIAVHHQGSLEYLEDAPYPEFCLTLPILG